MEEFEEILAYHLEQAHRLLSALGPLHDAGRELALRAAGHYTASARRASDRSDDRAAATLFRHAADLLPEGHPDRPRALYDVGRASLRGLDPPVAFAALDEAATAAAASGQRSIEWMARMDRATIQTLIDPIGFTTDDLRAELAAARVELEPGDDEEALTVLWVGLVQVEWMPCRFDAAREAAIRAVEHARRTGDRSLVMDATTLRLATELLGSTSPAEGWPSIEEAVTELGRDGLIGHVVTVHEACLHAMTGDFARAREGIREASALAEQIRFAVVGGCVHTSLGDTSRRWQAIRRRPNESCARNTSSIGAWRRGARVDLRGVPRRRALPPASLRRGGGVGDDRARHWRRRRPVHAGECPLRAGALVGVQEAKARGGTPARRGGRRPLRRGAEPLVPR